MLWKIGSFLLVILLTILVYINVKLYHKPSLHVVDGDTVQYDLLCQLRYLNAALQSGKAADMQQLYPEGFVFMQVVTGLAWCDFARSLKPTSPLGIEAHHAVEQCYRTIASDEARSTFYKDLPVPYGAFYTGWSNYLLGRKLAMEDPLERSENDVTYFKEQCAAIAEAVSGNKSPFPESYPDAAWPADIVIGIASLKIHDQLFAPAYESVISRWLGKVRNHLDQHGMIPHAVHSLTGKTQEHARGSSQSLMLIFIHEIDSTFGMQQFQLYRKYFLTFRLGIPVMREYPYGTTGHGDVDSGPVVFQAGAAASITGMRTLATYNDQATACALRNATEAFGFAITRKQEKKYLFGMLPMADAFIAWSHAGIAPTSTPDNSSRNRFHLYSVLAAAVVVTLLFYTLQSSFFSKTKVE